MTHLQQTDDERTLAAYDADITISNLKFYYQTPVCLEHMIVNVVTHSNHNHIGFHLANSNDLLQ